MKASGRLIVSILVVVGLAVAFWALVISPKREEADRLGAEVEQLTSSVAVARSEVAAANAAKRSFPADYRQLVVLGQAAPAGDETASLLAELEGIASAAGVQFKSIQLEAGSTEAAAAPPSTPAPEATGPKAAGAVQAAATVPATELSASLLPLGASIGPAGLYVMPYTLEFSGGFFEITDFVNRINALVKPDGEEIAVDGRLITIGSIALTSGEDESGSQLLATLKVTTFLSPPGEGVTAGATPSAPAPAPEAEAATVSSSESSSAPTETADAK